jgi:predicted nucleic acid-binding protein
VLGRVLHPSRSSVNWRCFSWLKALLRDGVPVVLPEIIDYEMHRELLRVNRPADLASLENMHDVLLYEPLTTATMRLAAQLWADARRRGRPTAAERALDVDVILAAQTRIIGERGQPVVVATSNVKHLSQFVAAENWESIGPD